MGLGVSERVRAQYERHPYPPVPALALPSKRPEVELSEALGASLACREPAAEPRLFVGGCGSLEALVVARANPRAREVVAVDASEASLRALRTRLRLARVLQPFARQAPITPVHGDLLATGGGPFDVVYLSNVLQHVANPAALLTHAAGLVAPHGLLRLVVYPRASRFWIRALQRYLRALGLDAHTPSPRAAVRHAVAALPTTSPLRLTFEANPESRSDAGVVDAFLHAHDEPLPLATIGNQLHALGFELVGERQTASSRSAFLAEVDAELGARVHDPWARLAILDESLELCANPVLWFARTKTSTAEVAAASSPRTDPPSEAPGRLRLEGETLVVAGFASTIAMPAGVEAARAIEVPNPNGAGLARRVARLDALLGAFGSTAAQWIATLAREVGPRVTAPPEERTLPGLALGDYDVARLRALPPEVPATALDALAQRLARDHGLHPHVQTTSPPATLAHLVDRQAAHGSCVFEPIRVPLVRA